jgi:hypothetical protein
MNGDVAAFSGRWMHSFEEDEGDVRVYRPAQSFNFPPSRRGRETLEFGMPGQVVTGMPGPDDRPRHASASLRALGMNRYRLGNQVVELIEASPEALKLRFV